MAVGALNVNDKPLFTADQIVNATDIQRQWKSGIEARLADQPYLVLLSGKTPRAIIIDYGKFAAMWQEMHDLSESFLEMEALNRVLAARLSGERPRSLAEVLAEAGITKEELDRMPDVELDPE